MQLRSDVVTKGTCWRDVSQRPRVLRRLSRKRPLVKVAGGRKQQADAMVYPMRTRHLLPLLLQRAPLAAALLGLHPAGAWAADCMGMRGGELVLSASDQCLGQMRRDPAVRRQMVQVIDVNAAGVGTAAPARTEAGRHAAGPRANLAHPLARLSQLNAQSRYLWSLGNPAPTYYGQTQAR